MTGPTWSPVVPDDPDVVHSAVPGRYYLGCSDWASITEHMTVLARSFIGSASNLTPAARARYEADFYRLLELRRLISQTEKEAA